MNRIRQATRRLLRAPTFAVAAVLTLALGIGGTTAVFTVVNGVLLRPLPYAHAAQLVDLSHTLNVSGALHVDQSDATYLLYRQENDVFSDVGLYRPSAVNVGGLTSPAVGTAVANEAERLPVVWTSASTFAVLGAVPLAGRRLRDDDDRPGAVPVVVLAQRLWQRKFGANRAIIGQRIVVDGIERHVVGVMPDGFHFPASDAALWLPVTLDPAHTSSAAFDYRGVARLRPGVSIAAATAELDRLLPRVPVVFPGRLTAAAITITHMRPVVRPLRDVVVGDVGRVLWVVLGASGVLLLIACANVGSLFLARAEGRQRELAVRRALGAGGGVLLAEFLSEAILLAVVGALLGLGLAVLGIHLLQATDTGASVPRLADVHVDGVVLAATAAIAGLAAIAVSAVTVVRSRGTSLSALLTATGAAASGRTRSLTRRALVVVQVAAALVLLAAAGLLARSMARLMAVDPGFDAARALTFRMALPAATYPTADATERVVLDAVDALRAVPGVVAAGVASKLPLDADGRQDSAVFVEDQSLGMGGIPVVHQMVFVTPGYFAAMGIRLLAGRDLAPPVATADTSRLPREAIVSAPFADQYWPGTAPVGRRIRMNQQDPWTTVVGIAGGTRDASLEQPPEGVVYLPLLSIDAAGMPWAPRDVAFVVRAAAGVAPASLAAAARQAVGRVAPGVPLYHVRPLDALVAAAMARTTFTLLVLGVAALVALALGVLGIYGVIAYLVSLRTRELGVRLALGARPADVRRLVVRHGLGDALLGIAAGLLAAGALTRLLAGTLYGVSPLDAVSLLGASAVLLLAAAAASWIPARRAAALDPAGALRE